MRLTTLALGAAVLASGPALAQQTRNTLDVGVLYNSNGDDLASGFSGPGLPARASLDSSNATGAVVSYEFYALPNVGLQLNAGFGSSVTIYGAGSLASAGSLFKAKPLTASGFVNYHFFDPANALRPFLGIGGTYSSFSGIDSYTAKSVDMSSAFALALQAGARYAFDQNWSMAVALGLNWTKSDVSFTDATGTPKGTLEFRPAVLSVTVGYSF